MTDYREAAMRCWIMGLIGMSLVAPVSGFAGPLYGTIREGADPVRSQRIEIGCPDFQGGSFRANAQTDPYGSFRVNVAQQGRCQLRIDNGVPITIFSSDNPIRYDFQVSRGPRGPELRRQ